ncbi:hypothetical protein Ddye_016184 [Dipteronia dyeriana]|uniref:BED-type domain-containing protein n=1 Tax=Dipteronia dyeriana TaxID=168575 RepID=A0AAD9U695_9ROSI|nr:hypothetical protein Ddye_016184 [Dipteronia dyeriana]
MDSSSNNDVSPSLGEEEEGNDTMEPVEANSRSNTPTGSGQDRKRKRTSAVWSSFVIVGKNTQGKEHCKCKYCGKQYICEGTHGTAIAIILDPRYKMEFVMFVYERLYGAESKQLEEVKGKLFALFNEYVTSSTGRSTIRPSPQSYPSTSSGRQRVDDLDLVLLDFDNIINGDIVDIKRTQLDLYLEERRLERSIDLNILDFWKGNEPRYPELAAMVMF